MTVSVTDERISHTVRAERVPAKRMTFWEEPRVRKLLFWSRTFPPEIPIAVDQTRIPGNPCETSCPSSIVAELTESESHTATMHPIRRLLAPFPRIERRVRELYRDLTTPGWRYRYEPTPELLRECVNREEPTILEIGCNDGTHTGWFFGVFAKPRIYCFEPEPRAIKRFKANLGSNPRVELFELAIGASNGEIEFYQSSGDFPPCPQDTAPGQWDYSGSIRPPKEHLQVCPDVKFDSTIKVPTSTLDDWAKIHHPAGTIDFIWMDVQGAEIDVIRGGCDTLARTRFVFTEYSERELYEGQAGLEEILNALGDFEVLARYEVDVLLRNKQFDFAPGEKLLKILAKSPR